MGKSHKGQYRGPSSFNQSLIQASKAPDDKNFAGLPGAEVARENVTRGDKVVGVLHKERYKVSPTPSALKAKGVHRVFVKRTTFVPSSDPGVNEKAWSTTALVVNFGDAQNGIRGLPAISDAEARKLAKLGFTHFVVRKVDRDETQDDQPYNESGFQIEWYKPKGGHEDGGETIHSVRDELSVLHYVLTQGFEALYDVDALRLWCLPETDEKRRERVMRRQFKAGETIDPQELRFHWKRLETRFEVLKTREFLASQPDGYKLTESDKMDIRMQAGKAADQFRMAIRCR